MNEMVENDKYTILVVEDDEGIRKALQKQLEKQGYIVHAAENGKEGLEIVNKESIDLAVVDIMMPVMDGIEMTIILPKTHNFPIIFLTAKSQEVDKVTGLMIGADDYMTKPFNFAELNARIYSQLRRYKTMIQNQANSIYKEKSYIISIGEIQLDRHSRVVTISGQSVSLRPKEFDILELLMSNPNRVYSANQIYELVWNEEAINTQTVIVHVRRLREKIELNAKNPQFIKVVWGVGYKFVKEKI